MALRDTEAFLRERAAIFDPNLDLTPGSPFDKQVIQPLLRRLGPDPFTVDLETFLTSRLQQAFPQLATEEGDGITDLLIKPAQLLWEPIVREIARVSRGLSFRDPNTLTTDEAEALGANLFAERPQGAFARGVGRIFFGQAQNASVTPVNLCTSKGGLIFLPTETQTIRVEEMLLNDAGDNTFYFDVNLVAEKPGTAYSIGPNELAAIANLEAAVRVTNLRRFQFGEDALTAAEFVDATKQALTEQSLVTIRGIAAQLSKAFPEVSRLNVVGFNDPEMQRDIVEGGGLGALLVAGSLGQTINDATSGALTRRFSVLDAGVDFTALVGPTNIKPAGYVLTVFGAIGVTPALDLTISNVLSPNTLEVSVASMSAGLTNLRWSIRRRELTLSGIPGGILFPDNSSGEVTVPNGIIHIGGTTDVYVRGSNFDEATLVINALSDGEPELKGVQFDAGPSSTSGQLTDLILDFNYVVGDEVYSVLSRAALDGLSLRIADGVNAGVYRVIDVTQVSGSSPALGVTPALVSVAAPSARWSLSDEIELSLVDIKDMRIAANDLATTQNSDIVTTASGTDFDQLGVAEGDTLRIINGADAGDYKIAADPLPVGFTNLKIDKVLTSSHSSIKYEVFRANPAGNLVPPLVRVRSVELLDSTEQPLGTIIPYAHPIDVQSRAFQNPARGVKHRFTDARLGLVSLAASVGFFTVGGLQLKLEVAPASVVTVTFTAGDKTPTQAVAEINAAIFAQVGEPNGAVLLGSDRIGIRPFGQGGFVQTLPSAATTLLFGGQEAYTTNDIRVAAADSAGWGSLVPAIDFATGLDVVQILDGAQIGFFVGPYDAAYNDEGVASVLSKALVPTALNHPFAPELSVTVEVGARSIGSVRVFFLEPTSFEVRADETFFSLDTPGGTVRFTPDPTLDYQRIPALPGGSKPKDGQAVTGGNTLTSVSQDFVRSGVHPGDKLVIDYFPLAGTVQVPNPVPGLVDKTFVFSVNDGPDKSLIFIRDDISLALDEVSRQGVVDQINAAAGVALVALTGTNTLEFDIDASLVIRDVGTANPLILGNVSGTAPAQSFSAAPRRNTSPFVGTYTVGDATATALVIEETFADLLSISPYSSPVLRQQFKVMRPGVQRISTSGMGKNAAPASLYYMDVELVSEGTGDVYNIDSMQKMSVSGFRSDGYFLSTEDPNLTFSSVERPRMTISKTILEEGVDDDPANATQLIGQNIQVVYDRSSLVADVNNFLTAETERVVNNSPLSRHLIPHFVRLDVTYTGGSKEEVVVPDLEEHIRNIAPVEALESSDIQNLLGDRGATSIRNPLDLVAIVHNVDRTIVAARSQDSLSTGRLAAFIPDVLKVVRNIT